MEIGPAHPHSVTRSRRRRLKACGKFRPCWLVIRPGKILSASWNSTPPFVPRTFFRVGPPDLYSGYGSPIFQFYAPLSYYAAEVPVLMGLDYATALKLTQLLALFFSGLAMYRLASMDFPGWVACVGAIFRRADLHAQYHGLDWHSCLRRRRLGVRVT